MSLSGMLFQYICIQFCLFLLNTNSFELNQNLIKDKEYEQVISDRYLYSIYSNQSNYWNQLSDVRLAWQVSSLPDYFLQSSQGIWLFIQTEKTSTFQMSYMSLDGNGTLQILSNIPIHSSQTYFIYSNDQKTIEENYTGVLISPMNIQFILCNQSDATSCLLQRLIPFSSTFIQTTSRITTAFFAPNSQFLYIGADSGLHLLNCETFEIIYNYNNLNMSISSLAYSLKYETIFIGTETKLWIETRMNQTSQWYFEHINGLIDSPITSLIYNNNENQLWIGQDTGITLLLPRILFNGKLIWYFSRLAGYKSNPGSFIGHLPMSNITILTMSSSSDNRIWLGSIYGLMRFHSNEQQIENRWRVFNSARYLPNYSSIVNISSIAVLNQREQMNDDLGNTIVAISNQGLTVLRFQMWTLEKKSEYFQNYIDQTNRHLRYGFVSDCSMLKRGDPTSCVKQANDNDGLWTSMYLTSQVYRYVITNNTDVKDNAWKHFQSLELLHQVTGINGYPARSFARKDEFPPQSGWYPSPTNSTLQFRGDTSSDEIVGHQLIYPLIHDYLCSPNEEQCLRPAFELLFNQTKHILDHHWYLIGENHNHTTWGIWNPEEINNNSFYQESRGLNSLQILSFLFQIYSFTGDEQFLQGIEQLIQLYEYDRNLINQKMIAICDGSYSDDELAYLSYLNLIYAFERIHSSNIFSFKQKQSIESLITNLTEYIQIGLELSHQYKQMEKSPFYNFIYCYLSHYFNSSSIDCQSLINDSIWYLQRFPLELINWPQFHSQRLDIQFNQLAQCSSDQPQYSFKALPPDERSIHKWNSGPFDINEGDAFSEEDPTVFLISYWGMRFSQFLN